MGCAVPIRFYLAFLLTITGLIIPFPGRADIYKCKDAEGKVRYQQTTCENGSSQKQTPSSTAGRKSGEDETSYNIHRNTIEKAKNTGKINSQAAQKHGED